MVLIEDRLILYNREEIKVNKILSGKKGFEEKIENVVKRIIYRKVEVHDSDIIIDKDSIKNYTNNNDSFS